MTTFSETTLFHLKNSQNKSILTLNMSVNSTLALNMGFSIEANPLCGHSGELNRIHWKMEVARGPVTFTLLRPL